MSTGVGGSKQFDVNLHLNLNRTKMNKLIDEAVNHTTISDSTNAPVNANAVNSSSNSMPSFQNQNGQEIEVLDLNGTSETQANTNMQTGSVQDVAASKTTPSQNVDVLQSSDTRSANSSPRNLEDTPFLSENNTNPENRGSTSSNHASTNGNSNHISSSQVEQQRTGTTHASTSTQGMTNPMSSTSSASNPEGANASSRVGNSLNGQGTMSSNPATFGAAMGKESQKDEKEGRISFKKSETNPASRFQNGTTVAEQFEMLNLNKTTEEIQLERKVKPVIQEIDTKIEDYQKQKDAFQEELKRLEESLYKEKEEAFKNGEISRETLEAPTTVNQETGKALEPKENKEEIAKELGYASYEELENDMCYLNKNIAIKESAIYKLEQEKKEVKYQYVIQEEDFKQFKNSRQINQEEILESFTNPSEVMDSRSDFVEEYNKTHPTKISAFELYQILKENGVEYGVASGYEEVFQDLALASKINPELENLYNYLYITQGKGKANQYLEDARDTINQLAGEQKAKEFLEKLKNDPEGKEKLMNHLKIAGKGLGDGVESFADGLKEWFTSDTVKTSDEYESMYLLQALSSEEDKIALGLIVEGKSSSGVIDYTENYGKLVDWNYKLNQGIGNMLPAIALSTVNPTLGSVSLGASSGGNAYHGALTEGYSVEKAALYGMLSGASDAMLEKVGGILGLGKNPGKGLLLGMLKEGGQEAVQELFTSGILDSLLLGKEIHIDELTDEMKESFIMGALVAGTLNGTQKSVKLVVNGEYRTTTLTGLKELLCQQEIDTANQNLDEILSDKPAISGIEDATTLGEIGDVTDKYISNVLSKNINLEKTLLGVFPSAFGTTLRFHSQNVEGDSFISNKILKDGLWHYTTEEKANQILESGYIKKSGKMHSYSFNDTGRKSFFFAGPAKFGDIAVNVSKFEPKRVAVKINVEEGDLNQFQYRKYLDQAVSYTGDYHFDKNKASLVYLGLTEENGKLVYKELSKEAYDNYLVDFNPSKLQSSLSNIKYTMLGIDREFEYFVRRKATKFHE